MKFVCAMIASLFAMSAAQALDVQSIEIVEHGIYAVDKNSCRRDAQGIERCGRTNIRHAVTTWTVPAQIGIEFGLRYRVIGAPKNSRISIKRVWRLPPPGFRSPATQNPILQLERVDDTRVGDTVLVTYGFDDPWELVPGPWRLEFWYENRKLGEQTFVVIKP